jgi:hypothetical protein
MPGFIFRPTCGGGPLQLATGAILIIGAKQCPEVQTNEFAFLIPQEPSDTDIPRQDVPISIEDEERVVSYVFDEQVE